MMLLPLCCGADEKKPNFLFIAIDDLRPTLGCYGDQKAITPHIDKLATQGTLFERAYCQQAVCAVSRLSLLTGRRPDTIKVWDLSTGFRPTLPDIETLPQFLKNKGYHTQSIGKIFHGGGPAGKDQPSWSAPPLEAGSPKIKYLLKGKGTKRASSESIGTKDSDYSDGVITDEAIRLLKSDTYHDTPFFLAVGLRKPHLPFNAPKPYWDLYQREQFSLADNSEPKNAPELATRSWLELEGYNDIPQDIKTTPLPPEKVAELHHGYYACVSYVDTLIGKIIHQLEQEGLRENTIIILWSDHGYHLGEQGLWTKANNYELSTRVPLILSTPQQATAGSKTKALVELVDIYPTLIELAGFNPPHGLEGTSLTPLLEDPSATVKKAAISQWPRSGNKNRHRKHGDVMGYALRTDQYRYVEWIRWETKKIVARELYHHKVDRNEMNNVVNLEEYSAIAARLSEQLGKSK